LFFSKMKTYIPALVVMLAFLMGAFYLVQSGTGMHQQKHFKPLAKEEYESPQDGALKYAAYEFNLLKDPVTGTIPEGVYAEEWSQALATEKHYDGIGNAHAKTEVIGSWNFKGPNNLGGRTRAIAIDVTNNNRILAGCISGGICRTTNGGVTSWTNVTPTGNVKNVSSIAQDTRTAWTNTWYFCTGEGTGNSASEDGAFYTGNGVYKSTDSGLTWRLLTGSNSGSDELYDDMRDISTRIAVDPTNGNVYLAATNSIWRSTDTGATWTRVLGQSSGGYNSSWMTDIVITTGGVLYASFSGAGGSSFDGVWTSTTGASASWTRIANSSSVTGWNTSGNYGRVVLALAPSDQTKLFALYWNNTNSDCSNSPAPEAEFFKYNSSTSTWTDLSANLPNETGCLEGNDPFAVQTGYDLCIAVKPDDVNTVFIGGTNVYRSTSGFTNTTATTRIGGYSAANTYALYTNHHPDIHELKFASGSSSILYTGDDGGIQKGDITQTTVSWTSLNNNYPTYQYYHVCLDPQNASTLVMGGAQDNGTTYMNGGSTTGNVLDGGDGASVGMSSAGGNLYYSFQNGYVIRYNNSLGFVEIDTPVGKSLFVTNFHLDKDNTNFLYYANGDTLFRTGNAPTVTSSSWVALKGLAASVGSTHYIYGIAASRGAYSTNTGAPATLSRLYVGTDNGQLFRIDDPQNVSPTASPANITPTSMTGNGTLVAIAVDPSDSRKVMAVYSNYNINSVWYTSNASVASPTWTNVEGNISAFSFRSVAILYNGSATNYLVGTSKGMYSTNTLNGSSTVWAQEASSSIGYLPVVDLAYRTSDQTVLAGTHGNGMFLAMNVPLPLNFITFDAKPSSSSQVSLNWSVVNAAAVSKYIVQRSTDGLHWDNGDAVSSRGGSNLQSYFNVDYPANAGRNIYYRIRAVEYNGNGYYSAVASVLLPDKSAAGISGIYPTVVSQYLNIEAEDAGYTAVLVDMQGRILASVPLSAGKNTEDLSHLPAAHYIVNVYDRLQLKKSAHIMKQ
jgi:hypothetical protein